MEYVTFLKPQEKVELVKTLLNEKVVFVYLPELTKEFKSRTGQNFQKNIEELKYISLCFAVLKTLRILGTQNVVYILKKTNLCFNN